MEAVEGKYLELVQNCINYARGFMTLPESIESYFEECPSDRFKTMDNAAEGCGNKLYFNKPWFTGQDKWENHRVDIEFFMSCDTYISTMKLRCWIAIVQYMKI